ncbi:MAG: methyl-accepting chemotaxis protein [Pirellulales bacterium]
MALGFRDLKFRTRMLILVTTYLAGILLTHLMYAIVIQQVRVGGEAYERIDRRKNAINDITPPGYSLVEHFLVVHQMIAEQDPVKRGKFIDRFRQLQGEYQEHHSIWQEKLTDPQLRRYMLVDSHQPAVDFLREVDGKLIPALEKGTPAEGELGRIEQFYNTHLAAITRAQTRAAELVKEDEEAAWESLRFWIRVQVIFAVLGLLLLMAISVITIRSILRSTSSVIERVGDMATGDADLTKRVTVTSNDEMGQVSSLINSVIQRIHDLIVRVRVSTVQLNATAAEIAASAAEQSRTVQHFNASTTQISAGVQEITATGQGLMTAMDEVHSRARDASSLAGVGRAGLVEMESTMQQLADGTGSISGKLGMIREKAGGINSVVTTITKVADQTNLLSINAAIEAEKAGEAGRGFLVVAREIRRLADQTAVATLDIDQIVRQMQGAVSAGVMEMDKFSDLVRTCIQQVSQISGQMAQIIENVQGLTGRFEIVNDGMRQQTDGAKQINEAMLQLTNGVQQVSATVQEFSAAAENLRQAARGIQDEVGHFTVSG